MTDRGYEVTASGLRIDRDLTVEEWRACGAALTTAAGRIGWAIGDWLIYGAGRGDYGEYYHDAQRITGRSFEALSQYARVSRAFAWDQRTIALPWSFYRETLRLSAPERDRTLRLAAQNAWTRDGLAEFISTRDGAAPSVAVAISETRTRKPWHGADGAKGWKPPSHHTMLECPQCGCRFEPKRRQRRQRGIGGFEPTTTAHLRPLATRSRT
jgi:hypothetical protein